MTARSLSLRGTATPKLPVIAGCFRKVQSGGPLCGRLNCTQHAATGRDFGIEANRAGRWPRQTRYSIGLNQVARPCSQGI
jgi:hypothetical protein